MEQPIVIENSEVLKKRIAAAGFGNRFDKEIDSALAAGKTEIRPFTSEVIENKRMDFEPEIKIKDGKGYFNGFKGTLHNEDGTTVSQWFKASDRISMDESHILMMDQKHPRAILKTYYDETGEKFNQWLQLDFTKKTENGNYLTKRYNNFDQVSKLNDYDFLELSTVKQKAIAAAYMSEGKEIELTPVNQANAKTVFMRANPERNTFTFLNSDGILLSHDQFRVQEARERIHPERSISQSTVSFVKGGEKLTDDRTSQENSNQVKKKNSPESAESLRSNKKQRVVQDGVLRKGKSI
ncbi:MAG: hypothetical protein M9904_14520 [Chitinophagaceae bacterium]|nr:hypothetical protein [Chitinophagaceae bacterium]MCO5241261.1 hypothetical protein [Chitinophagaceae bacterium]